MKTTKISLDTIKDEGWAEVANDLGLSEEEKGKYFEYDEYASIIIEIDENLNIVGGKIHKL